MARRRRLVGHQRVILSYGVMWLGILMIVVGLLSLYVGVPHPELATAGMTSILASGLLGFGDKDKDEK